MNILLDAALGPRSCLGPPPVFSRLDGRGVCHALVLPGVTDGIHRRAGDSIRDLHFEAMARV